MAQKKIEEAPAAAADPVLSAKAARLRYVTDTGPGIRRRRTGKGFRYIGVDGEPVRDRKTLERIRSLGIPPAYTDVWICPIENGHLQATGFDVKGRKQYRYHPRWREVRDETKYGRMLAFGEALPRIRERVERDLALPGLPREKVLAAIVKLLETTRIRVGNEEYARENAHYGLTTLRNEHVAVDGAKLRFRFIGKSGKEHEIDVRDRRLARILKRMQDLPGEELFQYLDDSGIPHTIRSEDVNEYLKEISGEDFTAKDFRTWTGTVLCALCLAGIGEFEKETEAKKNVAWAIKLIAHELGNTPAVCRKCYVHPAILDSYLEGTLAETLGEKPAQQAVAAASQALRDEEARVMRLLKQRLRS